MQSFMISLMKSNLVNYNARHRFVFLALPYVTSPIVGSVGWREGAFGECGNSVGGGRLSILMTSLRCVK